VSVACTKLGQVKVCDGGRRRALTSIECREVDLGCMPAYAQPFDSSVPAVQFGFGDSFGQVVNALHQVGPLLRVDTRHGHLMHAFS
jgi:hypothetical protein